MKLENFKWAAPLIVCLTICSGCGDSIQIRKVQNDTIVAPSTTPEIAAPEINFASTMSQDHKDRFLKDLAFLSSIQLHGRSALKLKRLMRVELASAPYLFKWLNERVRYIVPKNFDLTENMSLSATTSDREESSATTVAMNIGAEMFMIAKSQNKVAKVSIPGFNPLTIDSPRIGIIQEGNGYFEDLLGEGTLDDIPHIMLRVSTLFHEARHSDGRGDALCFAHVRCPKGHDYEDLLACDNNSNGPYRIGAELVKSMIESCPECSERSKEILRVIAKDSMKRILASQEWDPTPDTVRR